MDRVDRATRSRIMSRIRSTGTGPELAVLGWLRSRRWRVDEHRGDLPGRPDAYLPSLRLCVFVDGDFWHGWRNPRPLERFRAKGMSWDRAAFWGKKIGDNRRRDRRATRRLRRAGFQVVRVWEHDVGSGAFRAKLLTAIEEARSK